MFHIVFTIGFTNLSSVATEIFTDFAQSGEKYKSAVQFGKVMRNMQTQTHNATILLF